MAALRPIADIDFTKLCEGLTAVVPKAVTSRYKKGPRRSLVLLLLVRKLSSFSTVSAINGH